VGLWTWQSVELQTWLRLNTLSLSRVQTVKRYRLHVWSSIKNFVDVSINEFYVKRNYKKILKHLVKDVQEVGRCVDRRCRKYILTSTAYSVKCYVYIFLYYIVYMTDLHDGLFFFLVKIIFWKYISRLIRIFGISFLNGPLILCLIHDYSVFNLLTWSDIFVLINNAHRIYRSIFLPIKYTHY